MKRATTVPEIRIHKATGQSYVNVEGRRCYLGKAGTKKAANRYSLLLATLAGNGWRLPVPPDELTLAELAAVYQDHAQRHYRQPDGSVSAEAGNIKNALSCLFAVIPDALPVKDFSPMLLRAVRDRMVKDTRPRVTCNRRVNLIRGMFRWGVAQGMVRADVLHALQALEPLRAGRTDAPERDPIRPVPQEFIDAIQPHVSRQVWAMIRLQLLTGARPGEIVGLRPADLDMGGKVWSGTLDRHKTAYRGFRRVLYFGPQAQDVIRPFLGNRPVDKPLFSPAEAEQERREKMHAERVTPMTCGNIPGSNRVRRPRWQPTDQYTRGAYGNAIRRACKAVGIPTWTPHRLRHNAATSLRREFGLDVARCILGHRSPVITEVYAELDYAKAVEVIGKVG